MLVFKYFYWFFESRSAPSTDPFIIWLTGGPGCSSQLALLVENGPCYVNEEGDDTFLSNKSWSNNVNVMWVSIYQKISKIFLFLIFYFFNFNFM